MLNARGRVADACSLEAIAESFNRIAPVSMIGILEAEMYRGGSDNIQSTPYALTLMPVITVHRFQLLQGNIIKILLRETEVLQMIHELTSQS